MSIKSFLERLRSQPKEKSGLRFYTTAREETEA